MKAIKYISTGKITGVLDMSEEYLELQLQDDEFLLKDIEADDSKQYVDTASKLLVDFPLKPNDYSKFDWNSKQWFDDLETLTQQINSNRKSLLKQSDWTDTVSAQTRLPNYQQWQDYRQALRDIPQQTGYPENVIWPELPQ